MKATYRSFVVTAGMATLGITSALLGRAEASPEWCNAAGVNRAPENVNDAITDPDVRDALAHLVGASCSKDHRAIERATELESARARWNQELDITDAEWATDVVVWATRSQGARNSPILSYDNKQAWSTLDPIAQYALMFNSSNDRHYVTDALGDQLSEAGRLGYVQVCLDSRKPTEWALCQPDIEALDRKKLAAELRADKLRTGFERMTIRIAYQLVQPKLVARAAAIKQLVAKDPGYAKLFELAAAARRTWVAHPPDATALAAARAMDDARVTNSGKAFEGCEDTTWKAFATTVSAIPAQKFADLKPAPLDFIYGSVGVLVNDPDTYLAAVALYTCQARKPDALIRFLGSAMKRWPGFRGPRSAGLTAMITGAVTLDDRDAKIEYPDIQRGDWFRGDSSTRGGGGGPVAAVKPDGAVTKVDFVKKLRKEKVCSDWKDTNQVVQISPSGALIYGYTCLKYESVTINDASRPQTVNSRYAGGVKAKTSVAIIEDVVLAVWPKAGAAPSMVFGVAVK